VTEVRGERVVLRAFRSEEIDRAVVRMAGGSSTVLTGEAAERERLRRLRLERSGTRNEWEVLFAIEAGGRLIGDAQARCSDTAMPPGVWEIGLELWDEAERSRGIGREAVALLSAHLFSEQEAIRVQATTDVDNGPMRSVLERLGFGFEGVLRGFMPSAEGPPLDYAMYGLTKADWLESVKDTWIRTS
jgi:RimJ/RimL family protein N-acetyltransferase